MSVTNSVVSISSLTALSICSVQNSDVSEAIDLHFKFLATKFSFTNNAKVPVEDVSKKSNNMYVVYAHMYHQSRGHSQGVFHYDSGVQGGDCLLYGMHNRCQVTWVPL